MVAPSRAPEPKSEAALRVNIAGSNDQKRVAASHAFTLALPGSQIAEFQQQHLAKCREPGCEVLSTSLNEAFKAVCTHVQSPGFPYLARHLDDPARVTEQKKCG
jgi:hypothetical protein